MTYRLSDSDVMSEHIVVAHREWPSLSRSVLSVPTLLIWRVNINRISGNVCCCLVSALFGIGFRFDVIIENVVPIVLSFESYSERRLETFKHWLTVMLATLETTQTLNTRTTTASNRCTHYLCVDSQQLT